MDPSVIAPDDQPPVHYVSDGEHAVGSEEVTVGKAGPGEAQGIRHIRNGRSTGADIDADGTITSEIEGPPTPKADRELRTAQRLVEHLNNQCGHWGSVVLTSSDARTEGGIDATALDERGGLPLKIQTTVVERDAWQILSRVGAHASEQQLEAAAETVRQAILDKQHHPKHGIVLALDATDAVATALPRVAEEFGNRHGAWAAGLGYDAIWIVGPPSFVTRLAP
uniref:Uncharacterized protein n=1 Tax=Streptomyces sp. NBC_00003 TaxID=2903608 RepID=A0AAU2UZF2_9ACTN